MVVVVVCLFAQRALVWVWEVVVVHACVWVGWGCARALCVRQWRLAVREAWLQVS